MMMHMCEKYAGTESQKCDIAWNNAGAVRQPIPAGPVSYSSVVDAVPFNEALIVMRISARGLRQMLAHAAAGCGGGAWGVPNGIR